MKTTKVKVKLEGVKEILQKGIEDFSEMSDFLFNMPDNKVRSFDAYCENFVKPPWAFNDSDNWELLAEALELVEDFVDEQVDMNKKLFERNAILQHKIEQLKTALTVVLNDIPDKNKVTYKNAETALFNASRVS